VETEKIFDNEELKILRPIFDRAGIKLKKFSYDINPTTRHGWQ
jgi:hypothetical protein